MDYLDTIFKNEYIFTNDKIKLEIVILITILIILLIRKYQLGKHVMKNGYMIETFSYIKNDNTYLLIPNALTDSYTKKGWKKMFNINLFTSYMKGLTKFIIYKNEKMIIVKEGDPISVDMNRLCNFYAFSSEEDIPKNIKTRPIILGYRKVQDEEYTIICLNEKDCNECDKTQTIHIPI